MNNTHCQRPVNNFWNSFMKFQHFQYKHNKQNQPRYKRYGNKEPGPSAPLVIDGIMYGTIPTSYYCPTEEKKNL